VMKKIKKPIEPIEPRKVLLRFNDDFIYNGEFFSLNEIPIPSGIDTSKVFFTHGYDTVSVFIRETTLILNEDYDKEMKVYESQMKVYESQMKAYESQMKAYESKVKKSREEKLAKVTQSKIEAAKKLLKDNGIKVIE